MTSERRFKPCWRHYCFMWPLGLRVAIFWWAVWCNDILLRLIWRFLVGWCLARSTCWLAMQRYSQNAMVTSRRGNSSRITDRLWGNRLIPPTKSQWCGAVFFVLTWASVEQTVQSPVSWDTISSSSCQRNRFRVFLVGGKTCARIPPGLYLIMYLHCCACTHLWPCTGARGPCHLTNGWCILLITVV